MADGILNIAKGRQMEFHERVNNNDPTNAVLVLVLLQASEADGTLEDYNDLGALLGAAGNTEATFTNYARIVLTDADVAAIVTDDTNNRNDADITTDPVWSSAGGATNNNLVKLLVCYDSDSTGGTDANIIVVAHYDFVITTNGGDITAQVDAAGYIRAA